MSSGGLLSSTSHHQRCKPQGSAPVTPWLLMKLLPLSLSQFPSRGWESSPKGGHCQIYSSQFKASQVLGTLALLSLLRGVWSATMFISCRNLEPVTDVLQAWGSVRQCTLRCQHSLDLPPKISQVLELFHLPRSLSLFPGITKSYICTLNKNHTWSDNCTSIFLKEFCVLPNLLIGLLQLLRCKESASNAGDMGSISGLGRFPGGGPGNLL